MQFIVPQFIDVESKIIGPITPKQFIILILTTGLIFVSYKLADFTLFLIEAVAIAGIGIAIAFVKVNQQTIYSFLLNFVQSFKRPSLRIWRKQYILITEKKEKKSDKKEAIVISRKPLSASKLSQIALTVDTGGRYEEEIK